MNKATKVKTTLDRRHKDKITIFENKNNDKIQIIQKLEQNNKILEKYENISYTEYTQKIISNKADILQENKLLTKKLHKIDDGTDELLYYNNTIDYILPYYEQNSKQGDVKHMEIVDFFNNSTIVKKKNHLIIKLNY